MPPAWLSNAYLELNGAPSAEAITNWLATACLLPYISARIDRHRLSCASAASPVMDGLNALACLRATSLSPNGAGRVPVRVITTSPSTKSLPSSCQPICDTAVTAARELIIFVRERLKKLISCFHCSVPSIGRPAPVMVSLNSFWELMLVLSSWNSTTPSCSEW